MKNLSYVLGVVVLAIGAAAANLGHATTATSADPLSGTYLLHFEQTSKSCGPTIKPVQTEVSLDVDGDTLRIRNLRGLFGVQIIEAVLDRRTGQFAQHVERRVDLGPTQANLTLDVKGEVSSRQKGGQEIRFDVTFDKVADDPAWNCRVTGKGRASRIS
jgi:hypothetical protein